MKQVVSIVVMAFVLLIGLGAAPANAYDVSKGSCRVAGMTATSVVRTYSPNKRSVLYSATPTRKVVVRFGPDSYIRFTQVRLINSRGVVATSPYARYQFGRVSRPILLSGPTYTEFRWDQYESSKTGFGEHERTYKCKVRVN